jgi:uncharacterized protein YndB with AHSA1/START domain
MAKNETVRRATGRCQDEWYALLDKWGAPGRPYREIAEWLTGKNGISKWWAQKLIVEYEQDRGVRQPGARRNGSFEVGASKTVAVPATRAFEAFVDARRRKKWLPQSGLRLRDSRRGRSALFDRTDDASRVTVDFIAKGAGKSTVSVSHERLADARAAEATKTMWRERLTELKAFLEA